MLICNSRATGAFCPDLTWARYGGEVGLAVNRKDADCATAGVIKDAGDDPDVTHGALVLATVRAGAPGSGVTFRAGGTAPRVRSLQRRSRLHR